MSLQHTKLHFRLTGTIGQIENGGIKVAGDVAESMSNTWSSTNYIADDHYQPMSLIVISFVIDTVCDLFTAVFMNYYIKRIVVASGHEIQNYLNGFYYTLEIIVIHR